jgi:CRISPR-associated protein Cmr3
LLSTPGIFPGGWIPPGFELKDGRWLLKKEDISCRLVAAAAARAGVVSGWDLASQRPKTACRAAAAGSVYWCDDFKGDTAALKRLQGNGLWDLVPNEDPTRRAEGFNNIMIAAWPR